MGVRGRAVSPPILIESMKVSDLPEVLAIENVSFPTPFTENLFRMEMNLNVAHLLVARKDGKVAGYIDYWKVGPEIHLITVAVHPECRQHKIASSLLEVMIADARKHEVDFITLDVRPSNQGGLMLYKKFGFQESGIRKKYYQDNQEDALTMTLKL